MSDIYLCAESKPLSATSESTWIQLKVVEDGWVVVMMTERRAGGSTVFHSLFVVSVARHKVERLSRQRGLQGQTV